MNTLKNLTIILSVIILASCGGGNPEDEAKKICECMKSAGLDESKMKDCEKQWNELAKKHEGNKEAKEKMEKIISDCKAELDKQFTENVAKEFHDALNKKDYSKAKELATPKGQTDLGTLESMSAVSTGTVEEIESVKCEEAKEDKTTCTCKDKSGKETAYTLIKTEGKWKVDYSKMGNVETPVLEQVESDTVVVE